MEVVKEKRWLFEQSTEVKKKIINSDWDEVQKFKYKKIVGFEWRYKELLWSVEVVKEKRWVFEQSIEVKKIMVSETNCGSSNEKKIMGSE